jgi:hypothetical protein
VSSPAPPVEFELPERRGIGTVSRVVAALAFASLIGWWLGAPPDMDESLRPMLGMAAAASLLPALLCSRLDPTARLRYDGQAWWLSGAADEEESARPGQIQVIFDLQSAMLLRFVAASGGRSTRTRWLAVRRCDLCPRWHDWRGVVVGARSAQGYAPPPAGIDTSG